MFRTVMLLTAFVASGWSAPAQEVSDPLLTADMSELRAGAWTDERLTTVMHGLAERGLAMSAGFWLAEADRAMADGGAPELTSKGLRRERATWMKSIPKEERAVARAMIASAERYARAEAWGSAKALLERAKDVLELWPDPAASKRRDRVLRKLRGEGDRGAKISNSLKKKQDDLETHWARASEAWLERGVSEFATYGSAAGYLRLRALATEPRHGSLRKRLRESAVALDLAGALTKKARLWVMASLRANVWVDGVKVGTQTGELTLARTEESPVRIDFAVWSDSRVVVGLDYTEKFGTLGPARAADDLSDHALCYRLELDGKPVAARWRTGAGATPKDLAGQKLRRVQVGKVEKADFIKQEREGRESKRQVSFSGKDREFIIPFPPVIEDFFAEAEVPGTWMTGYGPDPIYVLELAP